MDNITNETIIEARDAAIDCVQASFAFSVNAITYYAAFDRDNTQAAYDVYAAKIKSMVKQLEACGAAFDKVMTDELLTALEAKAKHNEPIRLGKHECSTYHTAAKRIIEGLLLAVTLSQGDPDKLHEATGQGGFDPDAITTGIRREAAALLATADAMESGAAYPRRFYKQQNVTDDMLDNYVSRGQVIPIKTNAGNRYPFDQVHKLCPWITASQPEDAKKS